jgi:hypothetical protein
MNKGFLQKNISVVKKLKGNVRAVTQFVKIYNKLCPSCKLKVRRKPHMDLASYCKACQEMAIKHTEKARRLIK